MAKLDRRDLRFQMMLPRRSLAYASLALATLSLGGCTAPSYIWIVNGTSRPLALLYASPLGHGDNVANGSPWYWPWRTDPMLRPSTGHLITTYGYDYSAWMLRLRFDQCELEYRVPAPPNTIDASAEWNLMKAYPDEALQVDTDLRLYRLPTYSEGWVYAAHIPQPDGYPLPPATMTGNCKLAGVSEFTPDGRDQPEPS